MLGGLTDNYKYKLLLNPIINKILTIITNTITKQ